MINKWEILYISLLVNEICIAEIQSCFLYFEISHLLFASVNNEIEWFYWLLIKGGISIEKNTIVRDIRNLESSDLCVPDKAHSNQRKRSLQPNTYKVKPTRPSKGNTNLITPFIDKSKSNDLAELENKSLGSEGRNSAVRNHN